MGRARRKEEIGIVMPQCTRCGKEAMEWDMDIRDRVRRTTSRQCPTVEEPFSPTATVQTPSKARAHREEQSQAVSQAAPVQLHSIKAARTTIPFRGSIPTITQPFHLPKVLRTAPSAPPLASAIQNNGPTATALTISGQLPVNTTNNSIRTLLHQSRTRNPPQSTNHPPVHDLRKVPAETRTTMPAIPFSSSAAAS